MTLQLVKIEEQMCTGAVLYHRYVKLTPEEIIEQEKQRAKRCVW